MKRWKLVIGSMAIMIFSFFTLMACSPGEEDDVFYMAQKKLNKIESYSCTAEITVHGNRNSQEYVVKQWFKKPNLYRLEVVEPEDIRGKITISDGRKACIIHPGINQVYLLESFQHSQEQSTFLGYFIKNYLDSENVQTERKKVEGKDYLIFDTDIPGNHLYFSKERLWIKVADLAPYMLQVFDQQGQLRVEVKYKEFQYNPKLEERLFTIKENMK